MYLYEVDDIVIVSNGIIASKLECLKIQTDCVVDLPLEISVLISM